MLPGDFLCCGREASFRVNVKPSDILFVQFVLSIASYTAGEGNRSQLANRAKLRLSPFQAKSLVSGGCVKYALKTQVAGIMTDDYTAILAQAI